MFCGSYHRDKGVVFLPSFLQHISFLLQKLCCRSNPQCIIQIVNPSVVIIISTAVLKEYEKYLTVDRMLFMEGGQREIRLQLCQRSSLGQTPSSSLPLPSRVMRCYDLEHQNVVPCPAYPAIKQNILFLSSPHIAAVICS